MDDCCTCTSQSESRRCAALDGKIYLVGGYLDDKIPSNKLFIYDPTTDAWQEGKSMPTARAALTAQFIGNILYAVGGTDDNNPLTVNEAYDPATATWTSKANMPTPRQHMASGVVDDILYVIGGRPKGKSSNIDNNEAYDPKTDTWTAKAPMPTARGGIAAATVPDMERYIYSGEKLQRRHLIIRKYTIPVRMRGRLVLPCLPPDTAWQPPI